MIEGDALDHVSTSASSLLAPVDAAGDATSLRLLDETNFAWAPNRAPSGPLTVIISKRDQEIVVLRNGEEIGRSAAAIDDGEPGSHVISLTVTPSGGKRWVYIGLPGHSEDAGKLLDEATMNRVRMPRIFYQDLQTALRTGSTLLVTDAGLGEPGARRRLVLIDSVSPSP